MACGSRDRPVDRAFGYLRRVHAARMTSVTSLSFSAQQALRTYADTPMEDGDAVLLLNDEVCLEFEQFAAGWDDDGCSRVVDLLAASASRVLLAIAREGSTLLPGDYQLWRELHEALRDTQVELLPVQALPAA